MRHDTPIIIAHRGAPREAPENTLPAFARALELGADGIELDTLLTGDGIPIVTHNDNLSILTGFKGHARSTTSQEISRLDAGTHFNKSFSGTKIPRLDEVLDLLHGHEIHTIIEIKGQMGFFSKAADIVGRTVKKFKFRGPLIISSANIHILRELSRLYPKFPTAVIIAHLAFSFFIPNGYAKIKSLCAVHPSIRTLSAGAVKRAHKLKYDVHAWTANTARDVDRCIALGVDGIITDDVGFVREHIKKTLRR